jgi:hypothetical protein
VALAAVGVLRDGRPADEAVLRAVGAPLMETTTTVPPIGKTLTSNFPSASEMIGFVFGHAWDWISGHALITLLVLVAVVVWYFGMVIHRFVVEV